MDRRNFLKTTGTFIAGATVVRSALANAATEPAAAQGRLVLPLNRNWRFSRTVVEGAHARDFDDSGYERVVIPHTNIRLPWHSFDEKSYEFVSSYRRRFKLPPEARGHRVFVDFEGVMTASTVWINGQRLGEYKGGYTPFSFDLTPHIDFDGENVLAVDVDSSERPDIPPFGYQIDYLTFGGIYREVSLRIVPATFIENVFAKPKDVLTDHPSLDVDCYIQHLEASREPLTLEVSLREGDRVLAKGTQRLPRSQATPEPVACTVHVDNLGSIKLWDLAHPNLYTVQVRLLRGAQAVDEVSRTIGFREAQFTDHGFRTQWQGDQAARAGSPSNFSLCRTGDAGPRPAPRRDHPAQQAQVQYCADLALSAVAALSRCLRRDWIAGAGRDSGLAAYRRRTVEADID